MWKIRKVIQWFCYTLYLVTVKYKVTWNRTQKLGFVSESRHNKLIVPCAQRIQNSLLLITYCNWKDLKYGLFNIVGYFYLEYNESKFVMLLLELLFATVSIFMFIVYSRMNKIMTKELHQKVEGKRKEQKCKRLNKNGNLIDILIC